MRILIINGPNINLTGTRQKQIYGDISFSEFFAKLQNDFPDIHLEQVQSNVEGEIINLLHRADGAYDAILLNAAGYTHTSVSIGDAVAAISTPVVEVHISNILAREPYRTVSLVAPYSAGTIIGFGLESYRVGILAACNIANYKTNG